MKRPSIHPYIIPLLTLLILGMGCDNAEDEQIRAYSVPKPAEHEDHQHDAAPAPAAPAPSLPAGPRAVTIPSWSVPAGWSRLPDQGSMRVAVFRAGEGDAAMEVIISQFPGDVGGLLANVNRWRQQVGLSPIAENELSSVVTAFSNPGFAGHTMRLSGPQQHMLAAAIHEEAADRTWFVKAVATPAVADAHEADVIAFARSFNRPSPTTK